MGIAFPRTQRRSVLRAAGQRLAAAARLWWRGRAERLELLAMDERELRDIGLTRADARSLANKPIRWR